MQRIAVVSLIALAAAVIAWLLFSEPPAQAPGEAALEETSSAAARDVTPPPGSGTSPSAGPRASSDQAPPDQAPSAAPSYRGPARDRQRADELRELLAAMYAGQLAAEAPNEAPPPAKAPQMPLPEGQGNQKDKPLGEYVARMMREQFVPLAVECYEMLLERDSSAAGNVSLEFSIMGDASVGGVVVDVGFGDATSVREPEFDTCIRESMYAVIFDAPPKGHSTVTVTQSFELAP